MCPGVDSASKNEYQDIPGGKDGRCVKVTTLPPSCAECLEILEPWPTRTPKATKPVVGLLFYLQILGARRVIGSSILSIHIRGHRIKCTHHGDLAPGICAPLAIWYDPVCLVKDYETNWILFLYPLYFKFYSKQMREIRLVRRCFWFVLGRSPIQSRPSHRLSWPNISLFSSVPLRKRRNSITVRSWKLPSTSLPIHYSPIILPSHVRSSPQVRDADKDATQ